MPNKSVLIVDDSLDVATAFADLVTDLGHTVRVAHDGLRAIEVLRSVAVDVVLLDIGLPELDGYEVARRIRGDASLGSLRLVAVTGYCREHDRQLAAMAGFDVHLSKPIDVAALEVALDATGSGRQS